MRHFVLVEPEILHPLGQIESARLRSPRLGETGELSFIKTSSKRINPCKYKVFCFVAICVPLVRHFTLVRPESFHSPRRIFARAHA